MGMGGKSTSKGIADGVERLSSKHGWTGKTFTHWARKAPADLLRKHQDGRVFVIANSKGVDAIDDILEDNPDIRVDVVFAVVSAWSEDFPDNAELVKRITATGDKLRNFKITGKRVENHSLVASHLSADDSPKLWELVEKEMTMNAIVAPEETIQWTDNTFDRKRFFDAIRPLFGGLNQGQVDGMEMLLSCWEEHCREWDYRELAYNLGTSFHETARTMQPIYEYGDREYFSRYEGRRDLGNTVPGDGYRFRGAGHVQNTGRRNAGVATKNLNEQFNLGVDLVKNPDDRLNPKVSSLSLFLGNHQGWWTGKRLPNFAGYGNWNMKDARRVVNGTDRWEMIGSYAGQFLNALKASAIPAGVILPLPVPTPETPPLDDLDAFLSGRYPEQEQEARERAAMLADAIAFRLKSNNLLETTGNEEMTQKANFLDAIPFNGSKTYLGFIAIAVIALAEGPGGMDVPDYIEQLAWSFTGVAGAHKVEKLLRAWRAFSGPGA